MTAIVYFGEMWVASLLAIVLLAISQLRMSSDAVLFAGGVVALTLAEYTVHRFVLHGFVPIEHRVYHANLDGPVLTIFWQIRIFLTFVLGFSKQATDEKPRPPNEVTYLGGHEALCTPALFALVDLVDKPGLLNFGARKPHLLTTLNAVWWVVQRLRLIHAKLTHVR
jgi:hypothetical protein